MRRIIFLVILCLTLAEANPINTRRTFEEIQKRLWTLPNKPIRFTSAKNYTQFMSEELVMNCTGIIVKDLRMLVNSTRKDKLSKEIGNTLESIDRNLQMLQSLTLAEDASCYNKGKKVRSTNTSAFKYYVQILKTIINNSR